MNRYLIDLLQEIDSQFVVYDRAMESTRHVIKVGQEAKRKQKKIRQLLMDLEQRFDELQAKIQAEYK